MIKTNIVTTLVAFAIAVPLLNGAENEPRSRIPFISIDPHGANGQVVASGGTNLSDAPQHIEVQEAGDWNEVEGIKVAQGFTVGDDIHEKALLWRGEEKPRVQRRPYKMMDQAELKTLKWEPEQDGNLFFNINTTAELPAGPWLGVHVSEVSGLVASQLGLAPGMGLAVEHIVTESPAAKAGLRQYDILTKLDDQTLVNAQQLIVLVRAKKAGDGVKLTFIRGGQEQSAKAVIADRSPRGEDIDKFGDTVDDEDVVVELGAEPVVIDRKMAEAMNAFEKRVLASAMAKGKSSRLKQGMHTSLFFVENSNLVLSDDSGTYNLRNIDGKKRLVVLNPEGDTIYKGDLETEKSIEELPEEIREKVKEMTGQNKTEHLMRFYKKVDDEDHGNTTPHDVLVEEEIVITPDNKH